MKARLTKILKIQTNKNSMLNQIQTNVGLS